MGDGVRDKLPFVRWGAQATPIPYTAHSWQIGTVPVGNGSVSSLRFMFTKLHLDLHLPFTILKINLTYIVYFFILSFRES